MNKISRLKKNHSKLIIKTSRLKRKIFAEWSQINPADPNIIQYLTDAMTYGYPVQIEYEGSGWRDIQPYGWNTSKDGNVLVMCYKDTGEVRSYRLDRMEDMYIDMTSNGISTNNNPQMTDDKEMETYENMMNDQSLPEVDMPSIPGEDVKEIEPGIYDDQLSLLYQDNSPEIVNEPLEQQPIVEEPIMEEPVIEEVEEQEQEQVEEENNINESEEENNDKS